MGPFSLFVDWQLVKKRVIFYSTRLAFPNIGSKEFKKLTEDQQKKVMKFRPKPDEDLLEWLKSFDPDNTFNIKMYKKMIVTKKPFKFVYLFLNQILDEMEKVATDMLDVATDRSNPGSTGHASGKMLKS
ncbi:Hypothetical predicted protein [Paramuricea clavata]|nr:Hypothetical predicted protein [Paramuricea clavata]